MGDHLATADHAAIAHLATAGQRRTPGALLAALPADALEDLSAKVLESEASFGLLSGYRYWDGAEPEAPDDSLWADGGFSPKAGKWYASSDARGGQAQRPKSRNQPGGTCVTSPRDGRSPVDARDQTGSGPGVGTAWQGLICIRWSSDAAGGGCETGSVATGEGFGPAAPFVGRLSELDALVSVLDRTVAGEFGALVVSGDAGVGKTRLVEQACAMVAERQPVLVLGAACLPLTSMTVPLLPLRAALHRLPDGLDSPSLDAAAGGQSSGVPVEVDEWLETVSEQLPVLVVVDDLQWADESTLDVLMYVVAGSRARRLALLATLRRGEVTEGHPLQRWLADVRRLPAFHELTLGPMDRADTRAQLASLLGAPPHESLVGDVWDRSRGNAYLNRLLSAGLDPGTRHLAADLPDDLREAVLRAWHRLSASCRELVRMIAVGGVVVQGPSLRRAARLADLDAHAAVHLLREAVAAGVLDVDERGGYWFHHPLQAEALESSLAPEEARLLHAAFAQLCEADLTQPADGDHELHAVLLTAIADHYHRAGQAPAAYRWALEAAAAADAAGGSAEQLRLIRRAVDLHAEAGNPAESRREVLGRLRSAAARIGEHEAELVAVEALLALLDPAEHALDVTELLVQRGHLQFSTGQAFLPVSEMRRAAELSSGEPHSWQHALALAELSHAALWHNDPEAERYAQVALEAARAASHPRGLSYALAANSMLACFQERMDEAGELGRQAVEAAIEAADPFAFVHATLWEANAIDSPVNPEWGKQVQRRRTQLEAIGFPHAYRAWLSAVEAGSKLYAGEVEECRGRLRVALGSDPGASADVVTRLVAARLAALQGRQAEAEAHLTRAEELFAETSTFLAFEFDAVRTTVRLGGGDMRGALEAALHGATVEGAPPTMCEWLMPLAARSLAERAQVARDAGDRVDQVLAEVDLLVRRFPHAIVDNGGGSTDTFDRVVKALDALYAAEVARARRSPDQYARWVRSVELLSGLLPWEEAYAAWRAAEAALTRSHGLRDEAAALLRRADALARGLGAEPVLREVDALARSARIPLDALPGTPAPDREPPALDGLTSREREVLALIVTGRTYGEIARELVVSEKTVSTHVSHLLRKTGAANRIDLARIAGHATGRSAD